MRNGWLDERFDPEKSSIAYAKYMKSLYDQFGDWYLAMAAYDWGPGNIQRSVMRTGYADFWELYRRNELPKETKNYVPGIIAAIIMAKNPQQYGLEGLVPDAPVLSDTLSVDYAVDMRLVADVTNTSLQEIVDLNPSLLRMATPSDVDFDLHLPAGTHDVYLKRMEKIPVDKRNSWRFHLVRVDESLDGIASSFHVRPSEIATANSLDANAPIAAGDELVIPLATTIAAARTLHYVTRARDTLVTVADRFNVSVEDLRRWNHLLSSTIRSGRTLAVSEPVRLAPVTHVRTRKTRPGVNTHAKISGKTVSNVKSRASVSKSPTKSSIASTPKKKTVAAKKHVASK
jgi:membrane-bound lytic murein transglycosylase D